MKKSEALKILNLPPVFTAEQSKRAYRKLAMTAHPDKGGDAKQMERINAAYKLVSKGLEFGKAPKIDVSGVEFTPKRKPKPSIAAVIKWFAEQMKCKMLRNKHKGMSWRKETANQLLYKLDQERRELRVALKGRNKEAIIKECADVANFAMMIADNARRKLK